MWQASIEILSDATHRYRLTDDLAPLTWGQVVDLWQHNGGFAEWFSATLAECSYDAFFWETPPLTVAAWTDPFEFVLVDSPALAGVEADRRAFAGHLDSRDPIVEFDNLGRDAHLIAPTQASVGEHAAQLAAFVRSATPVATRALWAAVGRSLDERVGSEPLWCSTSGLGVYWLHVRIDTQPKYYTHAPYRRRP